MEAAQGADRRFTSRVHENRKVCTDPLHRRLRAISVGAYALRWRFFPVLPEIRADRSGGTRSAGKSQLSSGYPSEFHKSFVSLILMVTSTPL